MATTVATLEAKLRADTSHFDRNMRQSESTMSKVGRNLGRLALAGGAGVAVGIGFAVKAAADYESSLNTLRAITGASGEEMKKLGDLAKRLGADITLPGTSAKDAADALTELAKGGLSVRDSMAAAKGVLQLSAAAEIENAEAATITARALNSFGLAGTEAVKVADLLAATANASTSEISDLAQGMQQASAVFKQGGQGIDDLTVALGLMANAGIAGSDAGTSLKTMMLSLVAPSGKAAGVIDEMGIKLRDQHGEMLPLRELIVRFSESLGEMTSAQQAAALKTIFGSDAIRAGNVILAGGVKQWDKMEKATTKGGDAAKLAQAKMKGLAGAFEGFKSVVETLAITLGTPLLKVLTPAVAALSDFVGLIDRAAGAKSFKVGVEILFTGTKNAVQKLLFGSAGKLKPVKLDSGKVIDFERVGASSGLVVKFQRLFDSIDWERVGTRIGDAISAAMRLGGDFLNNILNWISAHADQIADLGARIGLLMLSKLLDPSWWLRNWQLVLSVAIAAFPITRVLNLGGRIAVAIAKGLGALAARLFTRFIAFIGRQLEKIPRLFREAFEATWVYAAIDGIQEAIRRAWNWIREKTVAVWDFIRGYINGRLERVRDVLGLVRDTARFTWDFIRDKAQLVIDKVAAIIQKLKDMVAYIKEIPGKVSGALGRVGGFFSGLVGDVGGASGDIRAIDFTPSAARKGVSAALNPAMGLARAMGLGITSTYRPGATVAGSGSRSDHSYYPSKAVDFGGTAAAMGNFARAVAGLPGVDTVIHSPVGLFKAGIGWGSIISAITKAQHYDHVHVDTFDKGGWLKPGLTLAANRTGRPEPVGLSGGGGLTVHFHGPVYGEESYIERLMQRVMARYEQRNGRRFGAR